MSQKIDISIVSSGASLADARLHRLTRALLRAGLTVEIFAPGLVADAPGLVADAPGLVADAPGLVADAPGLVADAPGRVAGGATAALASERLFIRKPWFASSWSNTSLLARYHRSRLFVLRSRGRVIYAISPEAVAPAYAQTKILRRKFAVDFFEDYIRVLKDRAWANKYFGVVGWIARSDTQSALWFAKRANLTTVADVQVPPFDARNRLVVRNLPDLSMLTPSGQRGSNPRAIYIGDLRKSRGLHQMLRVAELATDWEFDFVGGIALSDQAYVDAWLVTNKTSQSRVRFHGKLSPPNSWKFAEGAWVGLSLLESTPAFIEAVPSKLYEYMSVGLATISSPLPRCVELIKQSQSGAIESTPEGVAERLKYWLENPSELDALRNQGSSWALKNLDSEREYANFAAEMVKLTR